MNVMAKRHIFSKRMQHILRLPEKQTAVIKTLQKNSLAATRCKLDVPLDVLTNSPSREDAYMIVIQIRGKNSRELWLDGKSVRTEPLHAGGVVFHDLRRSPRFYFNDPLNSVNYFLERKTLDIIADDAGASRIPELKFTPGVGVMDRVRAATYPADFTGVRSPRPRVRALCGSHQSSAGLSYRPDIRGHEKRSCATTGRSRCMAGAARERADERQSSGKCFFHRPRDRMLTIGRTFRSRVSAFDRPVAAPMADPVSDRNGGCTTA